MVEMDAFKGVWKNERDKMARRAFFGCGRRPLCVFCGTFFFDDSISILVFFARFFKVLLKSAPVST